MRNPKWQAVQLVVGFSKKYLFGFPIRWRNGHFLKFLKITNGRLKGNLSFLYRMGFGVCFIREFIKFLVDPYYEPLSWFMILLTGLKLDYSCTRDFTWRIK